MNELCIDTESNTWNIGAPFDERFKGVCYSWATESSSGASTWSEDSTKKLRDAVEGCRILVGFNLKYDLHVIRKFGIIAPEFGRHRIWDTQLAEFVRSNQKLKYPSLEGALVDLGLGHKIDVVKTEYWDKGIQTEDIPWDVLSEYARVDAEMTFKLYKRQMEVMTPDQIRLTWLMGQDLLVLQEMEWNGIRFDEELCERRAEEIKNQIQEITDQLSRIYPDVPINFNSGDDLSAFLYGGTVTEVVKEHIGFFKSGKRIGEPKYQNVEKEHALPRLVEPIRGSELKKEGFYATNADTLLKLKSSKRTAHIIELIQKQVRLDSLLSKTYKGLIKIRTEQYWDHGWLHGQFNQVTVISGRLSSSKPNLQNLDSAAADLFVSRYNDEESSE